MEELQNLLEVMQKRLTIIDEKKSQTRPEIYAKVRAEYVANIEKIQNLMVEKGADLEEALNQAVVDRDTLNVRKQELRDVLDEMELRLAIGEIDEATKAQQSQESLEEMEEIEVKLASIEERIIKYQKLMQASAQPAKPAPMPAVSAPAPAASPKIEPRPAPQPKVPPMAPAPQPAQPAVPRPQMRPAAPIPEPVKPSPAPAPRPQATPMPKPVARPAAAPPMPTPVPAQPEPQATSAPPNEIDELEKQFASILGESLGQPEGSGSAETMAQAMPQAVEPAPEQEPMVESHEGEIKCPKCGSFNRADNWYCEKCGNELISAQDLLGK